MTKSTQPKEQMHDLSIETHGGLWRLQQSDGLNENSIIDLHPVQIRLLAEQSGLLTGLPKPVNNMSASHVRRLNTLLERIEELYFNNSITSEIMKCCGSGFEIMNHLRSIHEQAEELMTDIGDSELDGAKGETDKHC